MILYFVYKNKKSVSDEKVSELQAKSVETEEQKISEKRDQEIIDVVKLSALMCSIPTVARLNENTNDHLVVEPVQVPAAHTIEVAA